MLYESTRPIEKHIDSILAKRNHVLRESAVVSELQLQESIVAVCDEGEILGPVQPERQHSDIEPSQQHGGEDRESCQCYRRVLVDDRGTDE